MAIQSAFLGLVLSMPVLAQGLVVLEGASTTNLNVRILEESQLASAASTLLLQGIEVQPIEITGRRASQELDGTVPRVETRSGIRRVELPGIGRLLAYKRQGGTFWGYLLVPTLGGARVLLELPGIGSTGAISPFADRIAVGPDGVHAILPNRAGTTLYVVRLDGGTLANGTSMRTVSIPTGADNTGLMVGATHAFATSDDKIFRFPLTDGVPADLTPTVALATPRMKPEFAMSGDGSKVAFLYGNSNETLRIYLLGTTGPAAVLPPGPSKYEEPGYLPEEPGNVRLMLSQDGSRLFYIETGTGGNGHGGDESFLLDTTGVLPTLQITADNHFQPWIGIHILPAFKGAVLMAAIGDLNAMDWFRVELAPTGGTITNVTATGPTTQPFDSGTLLPSKVSIVNDVAFAVDVTATTQTLRTLDVTSGTSQLVAQDAPAELALGSAIAMAPDLYVPGTGDRVYSGNYGNLIGQTPPGVRVTPPVATPYFGVTAVQFPPTWSLTTFYLANGGLFFGPLVQNLEQFVLTPGGGMLINAGSELTYLSLGYPNLSVPLPHQGVRVFLTGAN